MVPNRPKHVVDDMNVQCRDFKELHFLRTQGAREKFLDWPHQSGNQTK